MKVCIVPAGYKPIPPVKGGAVETIVQNIIERNEHYEELELTVLSAKNMEAEKKALNYKRTQFVFFEMNSTLDKIYYWCVYKVLKKFLNIILPDYLIKNNMVKYVEKNQNEFDWIIFEGGEIDCLKYYSKRLNPEKIIYHSHGEVVNKKKLENCFGYYMSVSNFVKDVWNKNVAISRKSMSITLMNGVNQDKFKKITSKEKEETREKLGFCAEDTVLIYVGRIIQEKGILELLRTMELLPNNIKLLLIGSSNFGDQTLTTYEKRVEKMLIKLKGRVAFSGYIPNEKIGKYYQIGDISVVPSIFNDPAPLVIIESMAAGLPIITTGTGGIREYCDSNCAVFVEKGEEFETRLAYEIEDLSNNPVKMNKMGLYAKERAALFTDEAQYKNMVKILSSIT